MTTKDRSNDVDFEDYKYEHFVTTEENKLHTKEIGPIDNDCCISDSYTFQVVDSLCDSFHWTKVSSIGEQRPDLMIKNDVSCSSTSSVVIEFEKDFPDVISYSSNCNGWDFVSDATSVISISTNNIKSSNRQSYRDILLKSVTNDGVGDGGVSLPRTETSIFREPSINRILEGEEEGLFCDETESYWEDDMPYDSYFIMEGVKYAASFSPQRWRDQPKPKLSRTTRNDNLWFDRQSRTRRRILKGSTKRTAGRQGERIIYL